MWARICARLAKSPEDKRQRPRASCFSTRVVRGFGAVAFGAGFGLVPLDVVTFGAIAFGLTFGAIDFGFTFGTIAFGFGAGVTGFVGGAGMAGFGIAGGVTLRTLRTAVNDQRRPALSR